METIFQTIIQTFNFLFCTIKCASVELLIAYFGVYVFLINFSYHVNYLPKIVIMIILKVLCHEAEKFLFPRDELPRYDVG